MAMKGEEIIRLIKEAIPDAEVHLKALVADGDHYEAHIISAAFKGKTRIQQHQMVYQALGGRMGNELHALSLWTSIPDAETTA